MQTISDICIQAGIRANASDPTILSYTITEVTNWIDSRVRAFRWPFMRASVSGSLAANAVSITLPADYWKINQVALADSSGAEQSPLSIQDYDIFGQTSRPQETGTPFVCSVFSGNLYFYYIPKDAWTYKITYFKTAGTLTGASNNTLFPDNIIEQVAFIAAKKYDQFDTLNEEAILEGMVASFRRNQSEVGTSGTTIPMNPGVFGNIPRNLINW